MSTIFDTFTVEQGIEIQNQHLNEWKQVLKEEVYNELVKWAREINGEAKSGMNVRRGSDLSSWVYNYAVSLEMMK